MDAPRTEEEGARRAEPGTEKGDELRWLFRQLPGAAWITDRDLQVTEIIGYVEGNLGIPHEQLIGRSVSRIAETRGVSDPATAAHVAALGGKASSFRYRLGIRWYEVHVEPLRAGPGGDIVGCIGAAVDITTRVELEQRAAASEARATQRQQRNISLLEATLESTADGILVVDRHGKVAAYNRRFLSLWGIEPEMAARGDDEELRNFVRGQLANANGFMSRVGELYAEPAREVLDVLEFKDGRVFERYSRPQCIESEIVGRVWSFRDVTERDRLLRHAVTLAETSRLLGSLDAAAALESVARLVVQRLWLVCSFDLLDETARKVVVSRDPKSELGAALAMAPATTEIQVRELGEHVLLKLPMRAADRIVGWITVIGWLRPAARVRDLALLEEIAARCAVALENERQYRAARAEIRAREEFLAVASHELRGPIAAIRFAVEGLRSGKSTDRFLDIVDREEHRMERLVDELLDLGRMRAGELDLVLETVDLADVVREVAARFEVERVHAGSTIELRGETRLWGHWDRLRLDQVVTNLVSNAIKFGNGQPIVVQIGVHDDRAVLTITDQGIGIPDAKLPTIFEPFERAVPERHYGGLGLGLYIVRSIVTSLGGTVEVHSTAGDGTTFVVTLPREVGV